MKKKIPKATTNEAPRLLPEGHRYIVDEEGNIGRKVSGTVNGNQRYIVIFHDGKRVGKVSQSQLRDFLLAERAAARANRAFSQG